MFSPLATLKDQLGVIGTGNIYFLKTKNDLSVECLHVLNEKRVQLNSSLRLFKIDIVLKFKSL